MSVKKSPAKKAQAKKPLTTRNTIAAYETRDPMPGNNTEPEPPETNNEPEAPLPKYQAGCPECHERSLVTELKIHSWRQCRCRECGWRGEMED